MLFVFRKPSWKKMQIFHSSNFRLSMYIKRKHLFQTWRLDNLFRWKLRSTKINADSDSPIWESQFIIVKDIELNKEILLGSIYRPPFDNNGRENVATFIEEINPILSNFNKSCRDIVITGDFNINLLRRHYGEFLDLMLGYSLFLKITFPTLNWQIQACLHPLA